MMKNLLERLGLISRRARPVGHSLETGRKDKDEEVSGTDILIKVGIILGLFVICMAAFPGENTYKIAIQTGDVWRRDNLVAPFDYPIYKSEETLEEERQQIRREVRPVFRRNQGVRAQSQSRLDSVESYLERVFEAYSSWQLNRTRGRGTEARRDSALYQQLRSDAPVDLSPSEWEKLITSHVATVPGLTTTTRNVAEEQTLSNRLLSQTENILDHLYEREVVNLPADSLHTDAIVVRNMQARTEQTVSSDRLYGRGQAITYAREQFSQNYQSRSDSVGIGMKFFRYAFEPTLTYLKNETERRIAEQIENISRTRGMVQEGQVIVRRGDKVTEQIRSRLLSLERFRAEKSGNLRQWKIRIGHFLVVGILVLIFFLFLYLLRPRLFWSHRHLLLISLILALVTGMFAASVRLPEAPILIVPVAIASILLTVIYDFQLGLIGTVILALLGGAVAGFGFEYVLQTTFAGVLAIFSVRNVRSRGQIFFSGGLVFGAYLVSIGAFALLRVAGWERFQSDLLLAGGNAVLLLMLYWPLMWTVERLFNITTDWTLLELSDTNRPLLKELSMRAPGSFHHSLQVANLGEAAAEAIGANGLLVRVGALYHDIGKMLKPEYYIENQRYGDNPHDKISPHMSALILASHVKDGLELGKQHGLPQAVLDFIPMHHGTTLMEYFYRRAMDQEKADDSPVSQAEFRYPGPKPQSNETGILMLADSLEAACRSLDKPTPKKLESLVESIFQARIEDGQLDHCPLTFEDLETIKSTFLSILSSMHHVRVKYPDQEEEMEGEREGEEAEPIDRAALEASTQDGASIPSSTATGPYPPEGMEGTRESSSQIQPGDDDGGQEAEAPDGEGANRKRSPDEEQ